MILKNDKYFIEEALKQARIAANSGDIPVGCIVVYRENKKNKKMCEIAGAAGIKDGAVVARAYNKRNKDKNAISHAEILAISKACKKIQDFRLEECTMYVTLEPCTMCSGAIIQSRIRKVYFGAYEPKSGAVVSCNDIFEVSHGHNHKVEFEGGILEKECSQMMLDFFRAIRKRDAGKKRTRP